jgi:mannonate dehydratase
MGIMAVCEEDNIRMAVHPDDPPRPILGLPRIVSTIEDIDWLTEQVPSAKNGITMCTGSYGVCDDNDLVSMIKKNSVVKMRVICVRTLCVQTMGTKCSMI